MEKVVTLTMPNNLIGENLGYDRRALKGYKAENQIKRILRQEPDGVAEYLLYAHGIPETVKMRMSDEEPSAREKRIKYGLPEPHEYFTSLELLKDNIVSLDSRSCLKALRIYEQDGLQPMIDFILKISPIQLT